MLKARGAHTQPVRHASSTKPPGAGVPELLGGLQRANCTWRAPYLVCPDERLHCEVVFHQFVYVGLCLNQELCL